METKKRNKTITVIPFVNMSADVEHEYFGDGISEEIINTLSKIEQKTGNYE